MNIISRPHPSRGAPARRRRLAAATIALAPATLALSAPAHAYVGPGAGLGVIGTLFGIVAAIVLAMFGLLWYPLKRAFGKKAATSGGSADAVGDDGHGRSDVANAVPAREENALRESAADEASDARNRPST